MLKESTIRFKELFSDDLEIMEQHKTKITYLKGENIFKQGAFAPHIMYVLSGLVKIYLQTGYDKQINLGIARSGEFLAFSSVFGENVYTYSAQALTDTDVCMIEKESLKKALLHSPDLAMQVTAKNFRNESHLLEILKNLSYKQMRGKLASSLLYLSKEEFLTEKIFTFLSRQDIADFASVSAESAIKFLKEFEKEKILALKGKDIEIRDFERLKDISKNG